MGNQKGTFHQLPQHDSFVTVPFLTVRQGDDIDTDINDKKRGFSKVLSTIHGEIISKRTLIICHKDKDQLPQDADDGLLLQ